MEKYTIHLVSKSDKDELADVNRVARLIGLNQELMLLNSHFYLSMDEAIQAAKGLSNDAYAYFVLKLREDDKNYSLLELASLDKKQIIRYQEPLAIKKVNYPVSFISTSSVGKKSLEEMKLFCKPEDLTDKSERNDYGSCIMGIGAHESHDNVFSLSPLNADFWHSLTPSQIASRLWTCYCNLDDSLVSANESAGAAVLTLLRCDDYLIVGAIGDIKAFAVSYDDSGNLDAIEQLNLQTHNFDNQAEKNRMREFNKGKGKTLPLPFRSKEMLDHTPSPLTRALGYSQYKAFGLNNHAEVRTIHLPELFANLHHNAKMQILIFNSGFFQNDKVSRIEQSKIYVKDCLESIKKPGKYSGPDLLTNLNEFAEKQGSVLNKKTLAEQLLKDEEEDKVLRHSLLTICDGHGEKRATHIIVHELEKELSQLLALSQKDYEKQKNSVNNQLINYHQSNHQELGAYYSWFGPERKRKHLFPVKNPLLPFKGDELKYFYLNQFHTKFIDCRTPKELAQEDAKARQSKEFKSLKKNQDIAWFNRLTGRQVGGVRAYDALVKDRQTQLENHSAITRNKP